MEMLVDLLIVGPCLISIRGVVKNSKEKVEAFFEMSSPSSSKLIVNSSFAFTRSGASKDCAYPT